MNKLWGALDIIAHALRLDVPWLCKRCYQALGLDPELIAEERAVRRAR